MAYAFGLRLCQQGGVSGLSGLAAFGLRDRLLGVGFNGLGTDLVCNPVPCPAMRDGLIRRGKTWIFVVREKDSETGKARPR